MLESKITKPPELQFKVIRDELDRLIEALSNLLDREFPKELTSISGLQPFLVVAILTSKNIYQGIRYLAADLPKDPTRKLEFGLIISPLGRMLADILFSIVFMREDLRPRVEWYHRGGWRELKEHYERNRSEYGSLPEWKNWFRQFEDFLEQQRVVFGISEEDAANPKNLPYWPIPSRMLRAHYKTLSFPRFYSWHRVVSSPVLELLNFLSVWETVWAFRKIWSVVFT